MKTARIHLSFRRVRVTVTVIFAFLLLAAWQLSTPLAAHADDPTTFSNTGSIAIPSLTGSGQSGPADPYPSSITVTGMSGVVTNLSVTFNNLTHTSFSDIDAFIVAPTGETLDVISNAANGTIASNATFTFADSGATLPVSGSIASGTYKPMTATTFASAFTGITPNGTWRLYIEDESTGDLGEMTGGWSLNITTEVPVATTTVVSSSNPFSHPNDPVTFTATVSSGSVPVTTGSVEFSYDGVPFDTSLVSNGTASTTTILASEGTHLLSAAYSGASGLLTSSDSITQQVDNITVVNEQEFCNVGAIAVFDSGPAFPYSSNIFVSGLSGTITQVTASLKGLSHGAPGDFDILLSGPDPNVNLFLMSDAGGSNALSNVDLVFDDSAGSPVPAPIISGTYTPTNINDGSSDGMPSPAPTPSGSTTLSTFNGSSPNGTWKLWVQDDAPGDNGRISDGWCLNFTTQITGPAQEPGTEPGTSGAKQGSQLANTGAPAQSELPWIGLGAIAAGLMACAGSLIWRRMRPQSR